MPSPDQVLSLAAVVQCCQLVHLLATRGHADSDAVSALAYTVMKLDCQDPRDLLGGVESVHGGLKFIRDMASLSRDRGSVEVVRMTMLSLQLQKSLRRHSSVERELGQQLDELNRWNIEEPLDDDAYGRIDAIYQRSISPLRPSIIVNGSSGHLKNSTTVNRVRSLLLAAVRCAYLWYQSGGRIWHLVIMRKRYREIASQILDSVASGEHAV